MIELEKLSLKRFEGESESWMNMPAPTEIKELKFLDDFEQHKEGKEKLVCH